MFFFMNSCMNIIKTLCARVRRVGIIRRVAIVMILHAAALPVRAVIFTGNSVQQKKTRRIILRSMVLILM